MRGGSACEAMMGALCVCGSGEWDDIAIIGGSGLNKGECGKPAVRTNVISLNRNVR